MTSQETKEERRARFKAMSSVERKALIRKKMKANGLREGSGVSGKELYSYDRDEVWELIEVITSLNQMQAERSRIPKKTPNKRSSAIAWILTAITFSSGIVLYSKQFPSQQTRRELSVDVIFTD